MPYKNILVAIDLGDEAGDVLAKAVEIAQQSPTVFHVAHIIEPVSISGPFEISPALPADWETTLEHRAEDFLQQLCEKYQAKDIKTHVRIGSIKGEIFSLSDELNIDLIVLGTHGRHGIGLILGSTASSVLHGTPCDVLAVRIGKQE